MTTKRVMVTGGAGYIGSHTVMALMDAGWQVDIIDNLSTGSERLVPQGARLHVGDVGDAAFVDKVLARVKPQAIVHFAASLSVPESVAEPLRYYRNNFVNSCSLVESASRAGIDKFIFSSTAAVYGIPERQPVSEQDPLRPINPYGRSKLMIEQMLKDVSSSSALRYVALRYFNVAGADAKGRSGQVAENSTNLIKVVSELAVGRRALLTVHGGDYATADGTCIRDFIHVSDLATAHVSALDYLVGGGVSDIMNCGYGSGYSVLNVLRVAGQIVGKALPHSIGPRRAGDPAQVIADPARIMAKLDWKPRHASLDLMLRSAITWEKSLPRVVERAYA